MSNFGDFTLQLAPASGHFVVGYSTATTSGEMRIPITSLLSGVHINPTLQGYTQTAADRLMYTAMPAKAINVGLPGNTFFATGADTLTFSNATPATDTRTRLKITANASGNHAITLPVAYSATRGGDISGVIVAASTTLPLGFEYNGARWEIFGDPVATIGSGNYQLATNSLALENLPTVHGTAVGPTTSLFSTTYTCQVGEIVMARTGMQLIQASATPVGVTQFYNGLLGVALQSAASGPVQIALPGSYVCSTGFNTITGGAPLWLGASGSITHVGPAGTDDAQRIIGFGIQSGQIYFNPEPGYMTVQA